VSHCDGSLRGKLTQLEEHLRKTGAAVGELAAITERLRNRISELEAAFGTEAGALVRRVDILRDRLSLIEERIEDQSDFKKEKR